MSIKYNDDRAFGAALDKYLTTEPPEPEPEMIACPNCDELFEKIDMPQCEDGFCDTCHEAKACHCADCPECEGDGEILIREGEGGIVIGRSPCLECRGTGKITL
jgi:hypothetical protein